LCGALAQPLGSTGSALGLVAGYYDLKYRSKVELLRACSIPIAVLCMGILVLLLCLALYVPYVHILRMISGGAGS
jgi:type II secretory pathway component PulF